MLSTTSAMWIVFDYSLLSFFIPSLTVGYRLRLIKMPRRRLQVMTVKMEISQKMHRVTFKTQKHIFRLFAVTTVVLLCMTLEFQLLFNQT